MNRPWWTRRSADKLNRIRKSQDEYVYSLQERRRDKEEKSVKKKPGIPPA